MRRLVILFLFIFASFGQAKIPEDNWIKLDSLILTYFPLTNYNFYIYGGQYSAGYWDYISFATFLQDDSLYGTVYKMSGWSSGNLSINDMHPRIYYSLEPGKLYSGILLLDEDSTFINGNLHIDFTASVGDTFVQDYDSTHVGTKCEVISKDSTVTCMIGTFEHCFVIHKLYTDYESNYYEVYAPNIGLIKPGLVYAYIDSVEYPSSQFWYYHPPIFTKVSAKEHPPIDFALFPNYPNPFNSSTVIDFTIPEPAGIKLTVFDVTGKEVKTILNSRLLAGSHSARWDGADDFGRTVASGIYFVRLQVRPGESRSGGTGQYSKTIKAIYTR